MIISYLVVELFSKIRFRAVVVACFACASTREGVTYGIQDEPTGLVQELLGMNPDGP